MTGDGGGAASGGATNGGATCGGAVIGGVTGGRAAVRGHRRAHAMGMGSRHVHGDGQKEIPPWSVSVCKCKTLNRRVCERDALLMTSSPSWLPAMRLVVTVYAYCIEDSKESRSWRNTNIRWCDAR